MGKEKAKRSQRKAKKALKKKIVTIIFVICILAFFGAGIYIGYDLITTAKDKSKIKEVQEYMNTVDTKVDEQVEKLKEMQNDNKNIQAWIKINDTKINYPVLQAEDNEYYLTRDFKNEKNKYGSIFLKATCDVDDPNSNLMLYGHHMKDGEMFTGILKYEKKDFYENHKTIYLTTNTEVREYEVIAAFRSRVFYKKEKNVFRFYDALKFENEEEYNDYIDNVKKIDLYDTGVTAEYGEQLLTLITCEYSQDNGRFVVVAKRVK